MCFSATCWKCLVNTSVVTRKDGKKLHKFNPTLNSIDRCGDCGNTEEWHEATKQEEKKVKPLYATGRTSEDTCIDCSDIDESGEDRFFIAREHCLTCHHTNTKNTHVHKPGKCEQCNCGESDIEHLSDTSNKAVRNADEWYRGGRHYIRSSRLSYLRNGRPRKVINYK